jgi:hypothetical protein
MRGLSDIGVVIIELTNSKIRYSNAHAISTKARAFSSF